MPGTSSSFAATPRIREALLAVPDAAMEAHPGLAMRVGSVFMLNGDRPEAERLFAISRADARRASRRAPRSRSSVGPDLRDDACSGSTATSSARAAIALELISAPAGGRFASRSGCRAQRAIGLANLGTAAVALGDLADAELYLQEALGIATDVRARPDRAQLPEPARAARVQPRPASPRRRGRGRGGRVRRAPRLARPDAGSRRAPSRSAGPTTSGTTSRRRLRTSRAPSRSREPWGDRTARSAPPCSRRSSFGGGNGRGREGPKAPSRGATPTCATGRRRSTSAPFSRPRSRAFSRRAAISTMRSARSTAVTRTRSCARVCCSRAARPRRRSPSSRPAPTRLGGDGVPARVEAGVLEAVARHTLNDAAGADAAFRNALDPRRAEQLPPRVRRRRADGSHAARRPDPPRDRPARARRRADRRARAPRRSVDLTKPQLLEPLSERERAVLRYLPTMMSNAEIAVGALPR